MWGHKAPWTWPWAGLWAGTWAGPWDGPWAVPWDRRSMGLYAPLCPCMGRPMGRLLWPGPWAGSLGPAHGPALGPAYALCPATLQNHLKSDELIWAHAQAC